MEELIAAGFEILILIVGIAAYAWWVDMVDHWEWFTTRRKLKDVIAELDAD